MGIFLSHPKELKTYLNGVQYARIPSSYWTLKELDQRMKEAEKLYGIYSRLLTAETVLSLGCAVVMGYSSKYRLHAAVVAAVTAADMFFFTIDAQKEMGRSFDAFATKYSQKLQ